MSGALEGRKLRERDILTHCFQGRGDGLLCDGHLLPEALAARASGVVFDVGHGCGSFSLDTARRAFEHHFYPDTISTDLHRFSIERWCIDMPTTMAKFLHLGMPLKDIILKTTWAPAKAIGRDHEIGTLRPGSAADIFVFSVQEGGVSAGGYAPESSDRRPDDPSVPDSEVRASDRARLLARVPAQPASVRSGSLPAHRGVRLMLVGDLGTPRW